MTQHLVALLGMQQVDEPQRNKFLIEVAVAKVTAHNTSPVAERVLSRRVGSRR